MIRPRCRYYRGRYFDVCVHVLLVRAGVCTVPLVDVDPRDILPGIFLEVVGNKIVLDQREQLNRLLMLLLDLHMMW